MRNPEGRLFKSMKCDWNKFLPSFLVFPEMAYSSWTVMLSAKDGPFLQFYQGIIHATRFLMFRELIAFLDFQIGNMIPVVW